MYWIAQVRDTHALNHRRVAKEARRTGKVVEKANPGAEEYRGDVDADFVEQARVQQLLNRIGTVDANILAPRR
jgi:hypothetical protein